MPPISLLAPLKLSLRLLPDALHAEVCVCLFNHLMRGQSLARRLPALDGKIVRLEISDVPNRIAFRIRGERLYPGAGQSPDVTIRARLEDFWRLATRAEDPDTLFFQRRLAIEGDTETGLHVKNLLDALDYDVEAHVRAVLGTPLADVAVALLRRLPFPVCRTTT